MNHNLSVSEKIIINRSSKKLWEVLTTPSIIKEYLFGTETITDWKVGSPIIFQGEYQGHKYKDVGVILENKALELISYSYWSGFSGTENKPENYSKVSYTLKAIDNNTTELTWTQTGYVDEEKQQHSKNGMPDFLKLLKTVAEK